MKKNSLALVFILSAFSLFSQKQNVYSITSFGAVGDGKTVNTQAINQAIQACHDAGGGRVLVPPGIYVTGTIRLLSNIDLHLETGAVISGSRDTLDYLALEHPLFHEGYSRYGLLVAHDAVNITLSGFGEFHGNGSSFMHDLSRPNQFFSIDRSVTRQGAEFMKAGSISEDGPLSYDYRPGMLFTFDHCENLKMLDIQIKDPPEWTMRIGDCDRVTIHGVNISNNVLIPNNDGINCTNSSNVSISDCKIFTGDDAIAISSYQNKDAQPDSIGNRSGMAKNFTITNCVLSSRSSCIRIGDGELPIRNIVVSNIVMDQSNRGIGIFARDGSDIADIIFSNITMNTHLYTGNWWGKGEPIHISAVNTKKDGKVNQIKNIRFTDILSDAETGILIYGSAGSSIDNIYLNRVTLTIHPGKHAADYGGNFDLQPMYPSNAGIFKHDIPGLYAQGVTNLNISGFELYWEKNLQSYFTNGLEIHSFKNLTIRNSITGPAFSKPGITGIYLENGKNAWLADNKGQDQTAVQLVRKNVQ